MAGYARSSRNEFNWLPQPDATSFAIILDAVLLPFPLSSVAAGRWPDFYWLLIIARIVSLAAWAYLTIRPNVGRLRAALEQRSLAFWAVLILLSIPLSCWLIGFASTPVLMVRTALPAAPGLILVLVGLARLKGQGRAIMLLVIAYATSSVASGRSRPKEGWPAVVRMVASQSSHRPLVLFCPTWRAPAFIAAAERAGVGGPAVVVFKHGMARLVSRDFGRDHGWDDRYVALATKPALPAYQSTGARAITIGLQAIPSEVLVVKSHCPDAELDAMYAWLGSGKETSIDNPTTSAAIFRPGVRKVRTLAVSGAR